MRPSSSALVATLVATVPALGGGASTRDRARGVLWHVGVRGRRIGTGLMSAPRSRSASMTPRWPRVQARVSAVCPVTFDS